MVIDLTKCVGCGTCAVACKQENATPPGVFWSRVHIYEVGEYPSVKLRFLPTNCMQCEEPACEKVCPSGATRRREDGIVAVDKDVCIGCGYCVWACPYGARSINRRPPRPYHPAHGLTPYEEQEYSEHQKGIIEKCTFCTPRVEKGLLPACVAACPASARVFGDLDDPNSEVSRMIAENGARQRLPEHNTKPAVYYVGLDF